MRYELTLKILLNSRFDKERVTHQVKSLFEFGTIGESFVDALKLDQTPRLSSVNIERATTHRRK